MLVHENLISGTRILRRLLPRRRCESMQLFCNMHDLRLRCLPGGSCEVGCALAASQYICVISSWCPLLRL